MSDFLHKFCCDIVANNRLEGNCFHKNSYLKQNQLKWLLEKNNNYCNHWTNNQTIRLFGLNIHLNDFNSIQMKIVFTFVKKTLNELRTDSMIRRGSDRNVFDYDYRDLRNNVCTFLSLLRRRLFEVCIQCQPIVSEVESKNGLCLSIMKQMKGLLLFVGRLSQMKPQLIRLAISSDPKTSTFNYFHSCLDIWWTAIEVMYILDQNKEINLNDLALIKDEICGQQLCSQSIQLVLFDLIVFSVNQFNEMKVWNKCQSLSLFDCLCVKELYVLVRLMFEAINKCLTNDSFLELIFSTLKQITNCNQTIVAINDFKTIAFSTHSLSDPSLHFIWFVTSIVQTLNYDISGQFSQLLFSHSIPMPLLKRIIQFLRQSDSNLNEKLSAIIVLCRNAINFWQPTTDLLLPFTEYFLKNLNKSYFKNSVEELSFIPKTSTEWYEMVTDISSHRSNAFKENSFHLFLSLLNQQLSTVLKSCDPKAKQINWQKFKGKFVVNLHSNRLESFDETMTFNLLSFYLVLAITNHQIFTDFIDIIIENNIRIIDNKDNNLKNSELVFKFMFALLKMKPDPSNDRKICAFMERTFNDLCEQNIKNSNLSQRKSLSKLIILYFNEMEILLKFEPFLELSFDKLLNIRLITISSQVTSSDHKSKESMLSLVTSISQILSKQKKERILVDNEVFTNFIETNLSDECLWRLFDVINSICKSCPHLFHNFIGQITRTIESLEKKRGVGQDFRLRNALRDFANQRLTRP